MQLFVVQNKHLRYHSMCCIFGLLTPKWHLMTPVPMVTHAEKQDSTSGEEEWGVDQRHISQLKEQYKKERKGKKNSKCLCQSALFSQSIIVRKCNV